MNVLGYERTSLIDVCKAINRKIGEGDPFGDMIFHPDWIGDSNRDERPMDSELRLTFYAVTQAVSSERMIDGLWILHLHKATGHVFGMKVQEETEPDWPIIQTFAIIVPTLAIPSLRDI